MTAAGFDGRRDGLIGLGVLLMLTVAFIGGEAHRGEFLPSTHHSAARAAPAMAIELPLKSGEKIIGAMRELRIRPLGDAARPDLRWTPDESILETYRNQGL